MATTFKEAEAEVIGVMKEAIEKWHQPLDDAKLKIGVLMAENEDGPAVKHGGYPAIATIRPVPLKDRLTKGYDVELLIDEAEWNSLNKKQRLALLDHELSHVEIVTWPDSTKIKRDDLGRPKCRTRKGDWNGGDGFSEVVERHKDCAIEAINAARVNTAVEAAKARQSLPFEKVA